MLQIFSDGFRLAVILILVFFGIGFLMLEIKSFRKNILILFLVTVIGYLLAYWEPVQDNLVLFNITFFLSVSLPFAFWLMSKALFDDDFEWTGKYWSLIIVVPILLNVLYDLNKVDQDGFYQHFKIVPYLISVGFIFLTIYESIKGKDNDLILSRLKRRNIFIIFSSFLALLSVYFFFIGDPMKLPGSFELVQNIAICVFIFLFFYPQYEYKNLFVENRSVVGVKASDAKIEIHNRIIKKLLEVIETERLYTKEGLTISQLSEILNEKEYLVRRAINGEMGYTNFNGFLNHYRIKEAQRIIKNDKLKEVTFQEIAFQMGYQSVATFNRAFKKETGKTPSEFSTSN